MDKEELKKTLKVFHTDNNLIEVRVFNTIKKTENYSAIFNNDEDFVREVSKFDRDPYILYFIFNELKDATSAFPQLNKFIYGASTVKDNNIKYRRWLFLDFDPIREGDVKDIPSTDEEMERAHKKAKEVCAFLSRNGFPLPVFCASGNGYHAMYKIDNWENNKESDDIFSNFLNYISMRFTDEYVECDIKNKNAARLTKLYSTMSRKGGNTDERPHRISRVIYAPDDMKCVPRENVKKLADEYVRITSTNDNNQQSRSSYRQTSKFDIDEFLSKNGLEVLKEVRNGDDRKIVLKECPFDPQHGKDSAIFVSSKGITFTCFHNGCKDKTWRDLRLKFDPHAYDYESKPPYQYAQRPIVLQPTSYVKQQKEEYKVKEENDELGKKWLSMSDIKKIDIFAMERIKTGFVELDKRILGLAMGEVTILSGSNSSGKSSWLNTLCLNVAQQGFKTALWSGELSAPKLKSWIEVAACGKRYLKPSKNDPTKCYVPNTIEPLIDKWLDGKLFIYNNDYGCKWEQLNADMTEITGMGAKLLIFDNLFSMDIESFGGDKNNKQKELILQLTSFAKKQQVHIILVCHPRKSVDFLRKESISGTADLTNAADNVFICHRVNNDFKKRGAEFFGEAMISKYYQFGNVIEVAKNRMFGVVDYLCGMYYEIESRRFKNEIDEDIVYGWQEQGMAQETSHDILSSTTYQDTFKQLSEEDVPF